MKLGFVTDCEVKRYAENTLPDGRKDDVEQALLDDDRARNLVLLQLSYGEVIAPPGVMRRKLEASATACLKCVEGYKSLIDETGEDLDIEGAVMYFEHRCSMLQQLGQAIGQEVNLDLAKDKTQLERNSLPASILVRRYDLALIEELFEVFNAAATPVWKARIAGWLSDTREDIYRQDWLSRHRQR